jgi:hypothetical protein
MVAQIRKNRIDREEISKSGILPAGVQLFQDDYMFVLTDLKKGVLRSHPLLENIEGVKEIPVMRCTGVFQRADEKNANGRIYPLGILKEAVSRLQNAVKERRVLGEFDHPADAKIHLDRVCHLVTKLFLDDKTVMGEMEVLNDDRIPCGSMLAGLLDRNVQVGISSRGVGDMELVRTQNEDAYQVQDGFEFITFDAVAEPSVSGTQLQRLNESKLRMESANIRSRRKAILEAQQKVLLGEVRKFLQD